MVDKSVVHTLVHDKIVECCEPQNNMDETFLVSVSNVRKVLGHRFHINSRSQWNFIKELEGFGLLQVESQQTIKIFKH